MRHIFKQVVPLLLLSFLLTSCASYETHVPVTNDPNSASNNSTPATGWEGNKTVCAFLWGAIPGDQAIVDGQVECGVHDVRVTRDFWQGLCTIVTLGAVSPSTVQWKLGASPVRKGDGL